MKILSAQQLEFYKDNGYVIIDDFLPPAEIQRLRCALDSVVAEKAAALSQDRGDYNLEKKQGGMLGQAVGAGILRKIQSIVDHCPQFAELAESQRLLDVVEDLIGPDIYYHSSKLMFKPARHGGIKPWHQDYAYWASTAPEQVTCWLALDDATPENGCIQVLPGSHKWGLLKHSQAELQVDPARLPLEQAIHAPVSAGSLLCFHVLTFHYSGPNQSDKSRRAFIVDFDPNPRPSDSAQGGDRLLRRNGQSVGSLRAGQPSSV